VLLFVAVGRNGEHAVTTINNAVSMAFLAALHY